MNRRWLWQALLVLIALVWLGWRLWSVRVTNHLPPPVMDALLSPDRRYLAYTRFPPDTGVFVQDLTTGISKETTLRQEFASYSRPDGSSATVVDKAPEWTPDGKLIYRGTQGTAVYDPGTGASWFVPGLTRFYEATSGPWIGTIAGDGSVELQRRDRPGEGQPLLPPGVVPLVFTGEGPALGLREVGNSKELVSIPRPGASPRVVASGFLSVIPAPDAETWLVMQPDRSLALGRLDAEPLPLALDSLDRKVREGWWSPDSRLLLLTAWSLRNGEEIIVVSRDGEIRFRTVAPFGKDWGMSIDEEVWWSPDSRYFAFPTLVTVEPFGDRWRVHVFDTKSWKGRTWKVWSWWSVGPDHFTWVDERTVLARLERRLIRIDLR